jgi:hypothetical protein
MGAFVNKNCPVMCDACPPATTTIAATITATSSTATTATVTAATATATTGTIAKTSTSSSTTPAGLCFTPLEEPRMISGGTCLDDEIQLSTTTSSSPATLCRKANRSFTPLLSQSMAPQDNLGHLLIKHDLVATTGGLAKGGCTCNEPWIRDGLICKRWEKQRSPVAVGEWSTFPRNQILDESELEHDLP